MTFTAGRSMPGVLLIIGAIALFLSTLYHASADQLLPRSSNNNGGGGTQYVAAPNCQPNVSFPGFKCCCARRDAIPITKTVGRKVVKKTVFVTITVKKKKAAVARQGRGRGGVPLPRHAHEEGAVEARSVSQVEEVQNVSFGRNLCESLAPS